MWQIEQCRTSPNSVEYISGTDDVELLSFPLLSEGCFLQYVYKLVFVICFWRSSTCIFERLVWSCHKLAKAHCSLIPRAAFSTSKNVVFCATVTPSLLLIFTHTNYLIFGSYYIFCPTTYVIYTSYSRASFFALFTSAYSGCASFFANPKALLFVGCRGHFDKNN